MELRITENCALKVFPKIWLKLEIKIGPTLFIALLTFGKKCPIFISLRMQAIWLQETDAKCTTDFAFLNSFGDI